MRAGYDASFDREKVIPMALVNCSQCETEIAKSAKTCPKCGAKTKSAVRRSKIWAVILFGPFFIFLILLIS